MANTLFRCHGARFMRAVAAAVDNMDALDLVVVPNLVQLGRRASPASTSWSCRTSSSWAAAPRRYRAYYAVNMCWSESMWVCCILISY